jgi:NADPH2:quinone reductase
LLVVGFAGGDIPTVKVNRLLIGNTSVIGAASLEYFEYHPGAVADLWSHLGRLRNAGAALSPPVQAFPFPEARAALRSIEGREALGKVVLSVER